MVCLIDEITCRQSHTWPKTISYPISAPDKTTAYTASMIPVSHLAREGLTPIAMGMVLCNDTERLDAYVRMVQGLHQEGVVRLFDGIEF
jgi:hypothetical protein